MNNVLGITGQRETIAEGLRRIPFPPGIGRHQHGSRPSGFGRREAGRGRSPARRCHQSCCACDELVVVVVAPILGLETDLNGNPAFVMVRGRLIEEHRGMCRWLPVDGEVAPP